MSAFPQTAFAELERLGPLLGVRASLDTSRECAPLPVELAARVLAGQEAGERGGAFVRGLTDVVLVLIEDFPDNIFWDLDYLACRLWSAGGPRDIEVFTHRVVGLFRGFGNKSELRFRYAHDFLFGFDWARWVAREPLVRAGIGPFDLAFFDYLDARRQTLVELISDNDAKYGQLEGAAFRNPFTFLREPHEEELLHQMLAREDLIPVKAWRMDGERRWELPFSDLRAETARRLGITREDAS
ncbi:ferrochelatase [Melittangium boletus]|uniref:ferrochelatase n=1 Tax=Melittangium boletus TaxID=83453 RepID=UPI001FE59D25|nr:ferrochelatase [Melittangium boletus]